MIEVWVIYHTPEYPFIVRRYYGYGRTRVFTKGVSFAPTIDAARDHLPAGRELARFRSHEPSVVEVWIPRGCVGLARARQKFQRELRRADSHSRTASST